MPFGLTGYRRFTELVASGRNWKGIATCNLAGLSDALEVLGGLRTAHRAIVELFDKFEVRRAHVLANRRAFWIAEARFRAVREALSRWSQRTAERIAPHAQGAALWLRVTYRTCPELSVGRSASLLANASAVHWVNRTPGGHLVKQTFLGAL